MDDNYMKYWKVDRIDLNTYLEFCVDWELHLSVLLKIDDDDDDDFEMELNEPVD
jgi:hypothetical protein